MNYELCVSRTDVAKRNKTTGMTAELQEVQNGLRTPDMPGVLSENKSAKGKAYVLRSSAEECWIFQIWTWLKT
jgi:hypothetical protein